MTPISSANVPQAPASQTLSRGLTALELVAEAEAPLTIAELAKRLGLHRSITYRIVRTLEDHGLVVRNTAGELVVGARLAGLARNVARDLQSAALPELTAIANDLGMTAFIASLDTGIDEAVTLASVEPRDADAVVAQRLGNRHPLDQGAPGRAIRRQLKGGASASNYETSEGEVVVGLSSVAVPLVIPGQHPAALAVVYLSGPTDVAAVGARLAQAARRIHDDLS
jgi:DNA-binding IclR family transcriptional regulator